MTNPEKILLVVAGPNGSGKSSMVYDTELSIDLDRIINPDNYARGLLDRIPDVESRYRIAMESCEVLRNTLLHQGDSFGFETVASKEDKLDFVKKAKDMGYYIDFIFVSVDSPETCCKRIQERVSMGGHDVPRDKVFARYERAMGFLPEYIRLSDHAQVWDNSGDGLVLMFEKDGSDTLITEEGRSTDWVIKYLIPFLE